MRRSQVCDCGNKKRIDEVSCNDCAEIELRNKMNSLRRNPENNKKRDYSSFRKKKLRSVKDVDKQIIPSWKQIEIDRNR